ncbi:MAG: LysR family transcriptional regulator [Clostridia bacterium]|nr:LysR family transcriptional regulator [Clostridia bacterium]
MIDFELYRIFVAVAKEENITKASDKLNISQPAITKQIKNLENQLSNKLFERKSKGVALTEEGQKLYEKLKNPIEELNRIDGQVGKERVINIGTHNHMSGLIFGKAMNQYTLKYPDVNLNLICEEMEELLKKLKNKEIDIVFAKKYDTEVPNGLKFIKLGYMHEVFIVNKQSNMVNKTLTLDNLKEQLIYIPREYEQTTKRIKALTKNANINLRISNYRSIVRLVNEGMVIGVVTSEYLYDWEWEKFNLMEIKNDIGLGEVEFGIYLNSNRFKELNRLVEIIKENFNL